MQPFPFLGFSNVRVKSRPLNDRPFIGARVRLITRCTHKQLTGQRTEELRKAATLIFYHTLVVPDTREIGELAESLILHIRQLLTRRAAVVSRMISWGKITVQKFEQIMSDDWGFLKWFPREIGPISWLRARYSLGHIRLHPDSDWWSLPHTKMFHPRQLTQQLLSSAGEYRMLYNRG